MAFNYKYKFNKQV